jgi:hypothetical protein
MATCATRPERPGPLLPQPTAASTKLSMVSVLPPWPPQPPVRNKSGPAADTAGHSAVAVRDAVWFRTPRTECRARCPQRCGRLQESVVGLAATGGMQPAPVDASDPGGQAAAELAADISHGWPGERARLFEAQVVDLQPSDLAFQQPMTAWATWSGSTPSCCQVSWGQARSSPVRSAMNTSSPGSRSGWPVSSA